MLALCASTALAQSSKTPSVPGVVFDKTVFDFGDVIRENRDYTCNFIVENQSDKPLVLLSVNTSCSCLKASYSRRPFKPGEHTTITMKLEAAKMDRGVFHRVIEVHTNAGLSLLTVRGNSIEKHN